jgi:hypothetical protein
MKVTPKGEHMRLVPGLLVGVLLLVPRSSQAQQYSFLDDARIFVDVNVSVMATSFADSTEYLMPSVLFGENASVRATYPKPSSTYVSPFFDLGGGVIVGDLFAFGVSVSRNVHEDSADLGATIPHPVFFRADATDILVTEPLKRRETATHVSIGAVPIRSARTQLRLFFGPSFFMYQADGVEDVLYTQAFEATAPTQTVTISGFVPRAIKGSGIGFHAGADFGYFFTNAIGIGGGVRFSGGNVTVNEEPLTGLGQKIQVGGTQTFVGVRFRFWR